jgi:hypothetical protein
VRREYLTPLFRETFPSPLLDGVLYISVRFHLAAHRCCCGCGEEVITPLSPAEWTIRMDDDLVSIHPSIGNWGLPCKSHYWVVRNKVIWSRRLTPDQIRRIQARDLRDIAAQVAHINQMKNRDRRSMGGDSGRPSLTGLGRLWGFIARLFMGNAIE